MKFVFHKRPVTAKMDKVLEDTQTSCAMGQGAAFSNSANSLGRFGSGFR